LSALLLVAAASLFASAHAQQLRTLTLDDIYSPTARVNFSGAVPSGLAWIDASHLAWPRNIGDGVTWTSVGVDGAERDLFDVAAMQSALEQLGVESGDARRAAHARDLVFSPQYSAAAAAISGDLFVYQFGAKRAVRLTSSPGEEEHVSFSPDGRLVAFVRGNNLYLVDANGGAERALTSDGAPRVLNGKLDWVYEEEIYGRGLNRAYWWSPDSSQIAFLRIDDHPVPAFTVVDHIPYAQTVEEWLYPKAGDPNPDVTLRVAAVAGGAPRLVNTDAYPTADRLIVAVSWTPDSRRVVCLIQNRVQSFVDVLTADATSMKPGVEKAPAHKAEPSLAQRTEQAPPLPATRLLHEESKYWIDPDDAKPPVWLKDGSFLWLSTRSGFKHLYLYAADGTLRRQITSGKWELRTLHGVDDAEQWVYFSGTERSPIGGDVYRVKPDGSALQRLSSTSGTHDATFNPGFTHYVDRWSDVKTPPQVRLHRADDGGEVRTLAENRVAALSEFALSTPEFVHVPARDGFVMEAMMIKPRDFDPSRKYPVYQFTYGGPHAQQVLDRWRGTDYLYHQLLAERGIIVWICDNRTASGKGAESEWPLFHNFGELELRDIEDGIRWLQQKPYVDASRIGIHGWSFGGYMTSYVLTHSRLFTMGIAGGTVADWRDYDTVYTERYMGLPKDNPDGYRRSSPRWAAADLHGDLLLLHGTVDDNVHVANTLQFAYELQKANKPFQLMLYPKSRHGVTDPLLARHLRGLMLDYTLAHLRPDR
jgi:dipeptidyl-peptidase-4